MLSVKSVDFGYNNSEKADKKLFISFAIVFIIITVIILAICIHKSVQQKQKRLELLKM